MTDKNKHPPAFHTDFLEGMADSVRGVVDAQIALNEEKKKLCKAFISAAKGLKQHIADNPNDFKGVGGANNRRWATKLIVKAAFSLASPRGFNETVRDINRSGLQTAQSQFTFYKEGQRSPAYHNLAPFIDGLIEYAEACINEPFTGKP